MKGLFSAYFDLINDSFITPSLHLLYYSSLGFPFGPLIKGKLHSSDVNHFNFRSSRFSLRNTVQIFHERKVCLNQVNRQSPLSLTISKPDSKSALKSQT